MDQQRRQQYIDALVDKGATNPCQRCGNEFFDIVAESSIALERDPELGGRLGIPTIPVVLVACKKCGYIVEHALGLLGLEIGEIHA